MGARGSLLPDAPLRVLAKRPRRWPSSEIATWHAAYDLVHDENEAKWSIRVWSWFYRGWSWIEIREPEVVLDGREVNV